MSDTEALLVERGKTHGPFKDHAGCTQHLKAIMASYKKTGLSNVQQEALDMIAHKIGRILAGDPNYADHWLDISGYAMLVVHDLQDKSG